MSFKIDGVTWQPKTAAEHADLLIDKINQILQENNVTDKSGNIVQLGKNYGNALYLLSLSDGERFAENDAALSKAINSFNIELADDQQIENLLPIAAITRNPGSYSTLVLTCTASDDGACTIPAGTKAPYGSVNFIVQTEAVIQPGQTQNINTVCDTIGPVIVLRGEVTAFDTEIANLESVENVVSSVPGNAAETTTSLRQRILKGQTIPYSLDGIKYALEELTGINHARVYFNDMTDTDLVLPGGITLSPRTAYIVVNGESLELAKTYVKYMSAPTQNAPGASPTGTYTTVGVSVTAGEAAALVPAGTSFIFDGVTFTSASDVTVGAGQTETITFTAGEVGAIVIPAGAVTSFMIPVENVTDITNSASVPGLPKTAYEQDYVTASGQMLPIKYDKAANQSVFVKVMLEPGDTNDTPQIRNQLKRDLIAASAEWVIGESITSLLTDAPFQNCIYTKVAYTLVSTDGTTWSNRITVPANVIPRISDSTIEIGNVV